MVQIFIDEIRDVEIQQALRLGNPKKLEEALARALKFETVKQASRNHIRVRQTRRYLFKNGVSAPNKLSEQLKALTPTPEKIQYLLEL